MNKVSKKSQTKQSCKTGVMVSADYKGYRIEIDMTGYALKENMYSFFNDDGETYCGSGKSIEDCKQQIDEL